MYCTTIWLVDFWPITILISNIQYIDFIALLYVLRSRTTPNKSPFCFSFLFKILKWIKKKLSKATEGISREVSGALTRRPGNLMKTWRICRTGMGDCVMHNITCTTVWPVRLKSCSCAATSWGILMFMVSLWQISRVTIKLILLIKCVLCHRQIMQGMITYMYDVFCCRFLGDGLVTNMDNESWSKRRGVLNPAFHRK